MLLVCGITSKNTLHSSASQIKSNCTFDKISLLIIVDMTQGSNMCISAGNDSNLITLQCICKQCIVIILLVNSYATETLTKVAVADAAQKLNPSAQ